MAWTTVAALTHMNHNTDETNALLWTVDVDALIRVTVFLENPTNVGGASLLVSYTDTFDKPQTSISTFSSIPQGHVMVFAVKGGTNVSLTTSGLPSIPSSSNGYIAIEELQSTTTLA